MPSFYIARTNNGPVLPSFQQKGISDCMPGAVNEANIFIEADFHAQPRNIFKYVVGAISTKDSTITNSPITMNVFKPITRLSQSFDVPVASFRFGDINNDQRAELQGMGMQQDLANRNIYIGSPAIHNLNRITQLGPVEDRIRPGHISYEGFLAWVYLMKGVQVYTTTKNLMTNQPFNMAIIDPSDNVILPKGKGDLLCIDASKRTFENTTEYPIAPYSGVLVVAPPAEDHSSFVGSFIDVKTVGMEEMNNSVFFPYFRGMLLADKDTSFQVFRSLFQDLLAPTVEANIRLMGRIRSGLRQLAFSQSGIVLSHIYRCISIAEEVWGSKITVVLNGNSYAGCFVTGKFKVHGQGKVLLPDDISEDLKRVNLLESQAGEICALINAVESTTGQRPYNFPKETFMKSRSALRAFNSLDTNLFHSSEVLVTVKAKLEDMEFNDVFPPPTMNALLDAVKFMSTGDVAVLRDYPAYLGGGVLASNTRTWEALSLFGPKAPTCNTGDKKGTIITFPSPGKEDKNTIPVNGVKPLSYFPFWTQPLNVAVSQWDKMISGGVLSIPRGRKNKKEFTDLHRTIFTIGTNPQYQTLYDMIKGMVAEARLSGMATGKRKRTSEGGSGKGPKVVKLDSDADLL
jgi:hypothetical protein